MGIRGLRLTRKDGDKGAKTTEEGWGQWSSDYREGRGAEGLRLQRGGGEMRVFRLQWKGGGQEGSDYRGVEGDKGAQTTEE